MKPTTRSIRVVTLLALAWVAPGGWASDSLVTQERPYLDENRVAMDRMMTGMEVVPTGNVDRDFARMMIPHHQGAIDMARAELRYGNDQILRRIAQGIIVQQRQEIEAMQRILAGTPTAAPNGSAATNEVSSHPHDDRSDR